MIFENREEAASQLAAKLDIRKNNNLVLGIVRGGLVIAKIIADALSLPKSAIVAKKIALPKNPELALGAVTLEETLVIDSHLIKIYDVSASALSKIIKAKKKELDKTILTLGLPRILNMRGKSVIITDDGIATGATVEVVIKYCRLKKAAKVTVAVPVVASDIYEKIAKTVDKLIVLEIPRSFVAVGQFYRNFQQIDNAYAKKLIV